MNGFALSFSSNGLFNAKQPPVMTISCRASRVEMGRTTNLYKVLSLESETVGVDDIKKAYRRMARRWHPDACPPSKKEESTRMFVELCRAYETLSDPVLRRRHDIEVRVGAEGSMFSRETWEDQLRVLRTKSDMKTKAGT